MEPEILDNEYMRLKEDLLELGAYFGQKGDYELEDRMYEEVRKLTKAYREQKSRYN